MKDLVVHVPYRPLPKWNGINFSLLLSIYFQVTLSSCFSLHSWDLVSASSSTSRRIYSSFVYVTGHPQLIFGRSPPPFTETACLYVTLHYSIFCVMSGEALSQQRLCTHFILLGTRIKQLLITPNIITWNIKRSCGQRVWPPSTGNYRLTRKVWYHIRCWWGWGGRRDPWKTDQSKGRGGRVRITTLMCVLK